MTWIKKTSRWVYVDTDSNQSERIEQWDSNTEETEYRSYFEGDRYSYDEDDDTLFIEQDSDPLFPENPNKLFADGLGTNLDEYIVSYQGTEQIEGKEAHYIVFEDDESEIVLEYWFEKSSFYRIKEQTTSGDDVTTETISLFETDIDYDGDSFRLSDVISDDANVVKD
ncbi:hypothetical protein [Geomicrobium sp. JCM 19055]|uniref:hypothetical protein n=1 Tax=Geomicrobium sp. JCM 19055 TaxID=1460649 RepID=UPI00223649F0|nr:hypothetical protein [Geomicrobium sp. JCM 19055]